jgi:hypothetical protein
MILVRAKSRASVAEMQAAELEASVSWTSAATSETGSFTPPASALCLVFTFGRRDQTRFIAEPVSTHSMAGAWALLADDEYDIGSGNRVVIGVHGRFWSATPGAGTITGGSASGTFFQGALAVVSVQNPNATYLAREGSANGNSGTSIAVPYSNATAPPASMQGLVASASEGASTAMAVSDYTQIYGVDLGGPFSARVWAKLGGVANSATITNFSSGAIRAAVNVGVAAP